MELEELLLQLGKYGKWQLITYALVAIGSNWVVTWQIFSVTFMAAFPSDFRCVLPVNTTYDNNSVPLVEGELSKCERYKLLNVTDAGTGIFDTSQREYCPEFYYEKIFDSSTVTEFNQVCDNEFASSFMYTLMIIGCLVGALVISPLSDVVGRKPVFIFSILITSAAGVINGFMPNQEALYAIQFFRGLGLASALSAALVIACELFPSDQRVAIGTLIQAFWATGIMSLTIFGTLIRNWRYFMIAISIPGFLVFFFIWIIPESIQFLVAKGRLEEARAIFIKAAKMNGALIDPKYLESDESATIHHETKYTSPVAIFTAPTMRRYTWVMIFEWLAVNLAYWGLTLGTGALSGDLYVNFFINGLVELPATFICLWALPRFGRRRTLPAFCLVGCAGLLAMTFTPVDVGDGALNTTFAMIGKFGMSGAFLNLLFYTPEMLPTTHRNLGVGLCFVIGVSAGVLAPYAVIVQRTIYWLPGVIFSAFVIAASGLAFVLPETVSRELAQTVEDVQAWSLQVTKDQKNEFNQTYKMKRRASQLSFLQAKLSGKLEGQDNPVFLPDEFRVDPASLTPRASTGNISFNFNEVSGSPNGTIPQESKQGSNPSADNTKL